MQKSTGSGTRQTRPGVALFTKMMSPGLGWPRNQVAYVSGETKRTLSYVGYSSSFRMQLVAISGMPSSAVGHVLPRLSTTSDRRCENGMPSNAIPKLLQVGGDGSV